MKVIEKIAQYQFLRNIYRLKPIPKEHLLIKPDFKEHLSIPQELLPIFKEHLLID